MLRNNTDNKNIRPNHIKRNLEELGADVTPGLLQKSVVL